MSFSLKTVSINLQWHSEGGERGECRIAELDHPDEREPEYFLKVFEEELLEMKLSWSQSS